MYASEIPLRALIGNFNGRNLNWRQRTYLALKQYTSMAGVMSFMQDAAGALIELGVAMTPDSAEDIIDRKFFGYPTSEAPRRSTMEYLYGRALNNYPTYNQADDHCRI